MAGEKPGKPRFGAKSDFVRSLDRSLSAAEVIALAEKRGLRLTPAFVYNIRSAQAARVGLIRPGKNGNSLLKGSPEAQLRAAIAQIGLTRARQILEEVEKTFAGG
jgi:hypothetical protein